MGYTAEVDDNGLDAVSLSFDFRLETFHLVPVEGIGDILEEMVRRIPSYAGRERLTRRMLRVAIVGSQIKYCSRKMQIFCSLELDGETAKGCRKRHPVCP